MPLPQLSQFSLDKVKAELQPSSLKGRAQSLNDRYTSPSTSQTGYNRFAPKPARPTPPSLPSSSSSSSHVASGPSHVPPPPPQRRNGGYASQAPALPTRNDVPTEEHSKVPQGIDWQNLSQHDKQEFFALMDGFFSARSHVASALRADPGADILVPPQAPPAKPTKVEVSAREAQDQPPAPALWARPSMTTPAAAATASSAGPHELSYPTPSRTASHGQDTAEYFSPSQVWQDAWFTAEQPMPPMLAGRRDITWTSSWQSTGTSKSLTGAALFSDLSACWWKVDWNTAHEQRPGFQQNVQRQARHLEKPAPFSSEQLWDAHSSYGEQVALFAEEAERRGRPIGHGECWDMASEALAFVSGIPPPVPSIARTHGHLIFSGKANGKDKSQQWGRWRGGDTAVRRGDIVEWRTVRVRKPDGLGWSDLGNPDHTAVIVNTYMCEDDRANREPQDGDSLAPWAVGILEVIEQSQGKMPSRAEYDLSGMESGEIWIYRPVGMRDYLGVDQLKADWHQSSQRGYIHSIP